MSATKYAIENIAQARDSLYLFYEERKPFLSCEPFISEKAPGFIVIAIITDFSELQVEIISHHQLLSMHQEVKERIQGGECLHDAWLNAMGILYE